MARTTVHPYFTPTTIAAHTASPRRFKLDFFSSRTLAGMLLAAAVAALLVVADQLIDTWAQGHLLAVWVALWTVAFAAMALLTPPMRQLAEVAAATLTRWSRQRATRRADAIMWRLAQQDHRIMRDLQMATQRSEYEA